MTKRIRRRLLIGLIAVPALLVLLDFLAWRAAEQQLRAGFAQFLAARRSEGWTVNAGTAAAGGWPLAATLSVPDVFLSGGGAQMQGGVTWSADRLSLSVALIAPARLVVGLQGQQRLRLGDAPEVPFTADRLEATVPLTDGAAPHAVQVTAARLRAGLPPGGASLSIAALHLELTMAQATTQADAALRFTLQADGVDLPTGPRWALGPQVAALRLGGVLSGPLPGGALPEGPALVPLLTAWRDGGGTLQVQQLALHWGPLDLSGTATLSLDGHLQPMGAASTSISGQAAALDAMAANGVIRPPAAMAAKAVLALMTAPGAAGQPDTAEVPLTLQDRTLSMGRIPLVRFPQWEWPAP